MKQYFLSVPLYAFFQEIQIYRRLTSAPAWDSWRARSRRAPGRRRIGGRSSPRTRRRPSPSHFRHWESSSSSSVSLSTSRPDPKPSSRRSSAAAFLCFFYSFSFLLFCTYPNISGCDTIYLNYNFYVPLFPSNSPRQQEILPPLLHVWTLMTFFVNLYLSKHWKLVKSSVYTFLLHKLCRDQYLTSLGLCRISIYHIAVINVLTTWNICSIFYVWYRSTTRYTYVLN